RDESRRDSGSKLRVARHELPWETGSQVNNPNGVAARRRKGDTTPLALEPLRAGTRGKTEQQTQCFASRTARCLATLGWKTQSLWDCRSGRFPVISSIFRARGISERHYS